MEQSDTLQRIWEVLQHIEELLEDQRGNGGKTIMNTDEVAKYTGYVKKYIYKLTGEKKIPHYKRGGKVFFRKEEIDQWMHENRVRTDDEIDQAASNYCATH